MFLEAMNESGLEFTMFDPRYCYSFVVQHPKNRIVSVIDKPTIYLIAIYQIDNENKKVYEKQRHAYDIYINHDLFIKQTPKD